MRACVYGLVERLALMIKNISLFFQRFWKRTHSSDERVCMCVCLCKTARAFAPWNIHICAILKMQTRKY